MNDSKDKEFLRLQQRKGREGSLETIVDTSLATNKTNSEEDQTKSPYLISLIF